MSLRRIFVLARRVIQQLMGDHRTIALLLFIPAVLLPLAGALVRSEGSSIRIGIVMNDQGAAMPLNLGQINLGQRLTENLSSLSGNLIVTTLQADAVPTAIDRAEVDAVITFDSDFSRNAIQNRTLTLNVLFEGSNPMAARLLDTMITRGATGALASMSGITNQQSMPSIKVNATYRYGSAEFDTLDYIAPVFIGLFVFLFVFLLTTVSFLRERSSGTFERLQATPIRHVEIVLGYMFGFILFALAQALIILLFTIFGLRIHFLGNIALIFVVEILLATMAVNLGIFFSAFARNEFQVVQFIPLVIVTQMLLSGALWPIKDMPGWLQPIAWLMPLTHANQALRDVMIKGFDLGGIAGYVVTLLGFAALFVLLAVGMIKLQRQS